MLSIQIIVGCIIEVLLCFLYVINIHSASEHTELEIDPDLYITVNEPEAWSVTVDKRTLKKMSAKDIKRQDHIWGEQGYVMWLYMWLYTYYLVDWFICGFMRKFCGYILIQATQKLVSNLEFTQ